MLGRTEPTPTADSPAMPAGSLRVTIALTPTTAARLDPDEIKLPGTEVRVIDTGLTGFQTNGGLQRWTDVLVVEVDGQDARQIESFERFCRDHADQLPVIGAVRDLTVAVTRSMLRASAVDVMPLPFSPDELLQALELGRERLTAMRPDNNHRSGRVISFVGALGGIGVTALATQAALLWAEDSHVCLIDLDIQFGCAALYANVRSQLSLADLIEAGERIDTELVRSVAETHPSGLSIISSPPDILPLEALTPEFVGRLIDIAAEVYDVVLLDLPGAWVSWSLAALQKSDLVAMVTGVSVAGIHQARRQLELLDANGLADRMRMIANRVPASLFGKTDLTEAEKLLRRAFAATIVDDQATMATALDEGRRIGSIKMRSRVEKDLRELVGMLSEVYDEVEV